MFSNQFYTFIENTETTHCMRSSLNRLERISLNMIKMSLKPHVDQSIV